MRLDPDARWAITCGSSSRALRMGGLAPLLNFKVQKSGDRPSHQLPKVAYKVFGT